MERYIITDIDLFVESTRVLVYSLFGTNKNDEDEENFNLSYDALTEDEQIEIDKCLTHQESAVIAKDFVKIKTKKNKKFHTISDQEYVSFMEALNSRLVSNMLNSMTRLGILESAFDDKSNDFIFWVADENNNKTNPPE